MKTIVLYIGSMQKGGAQRVMSVLAKHLLDQGHSVIMINDIRPAVDKPEYYLPDTIQRVYLDISKKVGIRKNAARIVRLRKIIKRIKPDCVLSFEGPPNIRMLIATIGMKCRKIVSVRNDPHFEYGYGIRRIIANCVFLLADKCIFQTQDASNYFVKKIRKSSSILFNPVGDSFYKYEWYGDSESVVMVGRLEEQKNIGMAIKAIRIIKEKGGDIHLKIFGEGTQRELLIQQVKDLKLEDSIEFCGLVDNVAEVLSHAKCFILTSDYEGMPNALMEAITIGVPAISTDCPCGGPKSVMTDEEGVCAGILVNCNDSVTLAAKICEIIMNPDMQKAINLREKERAKAFMSEIILAKWEGILLEE